MSEQRPSIELQNVPRLCYAMQQSAVPWLLAVRLHNPGDAELADPCVTIELEPPLAEPLEWRVAAVPAGDSVALRKPDPRLDPQRLANLLERVRGEVRATVRDGAGTVIATAHSPIEVLAYNEWPGLAVMPPLLAAFVAPNHPALAVLLRDVSARLEERTGNGALDGYQSGDPARARAMLAAVHDAVRAQEVRYVSPPPSFERVGQKVRTPEQVLGDRLATCLDLALVYAALLEHIGLQPLVVLQKEHAFVGAWLVPASTANPTFGPALELRKHCDLRGLAVVECTAACATNDRAFEVAERLARAHLDDDERYVTAVDIAASRHLGVGPLPPRTSTFRAEVAAANPPRPSEPPAPAAASVLAAEPAAVEPPAERAPKDRLEHWKGKLLDLTMFNRLLNFRETRKTIRLCEHDLAALEDRLQQSGKLRVRSRPTLGEADDPRDLELAAQRTGVDVRAEFLADELRSGRLRAEHDDEDLDARLVEIYRHARTSLEESGANTLYLAVGFLRWFETPESQKPRRAPLLLLPLVIERLSVQEGFRFVLDDAEPRINQTLLQLLARDFELAVALDGVPEDDRGVDIGAVLDAFRTAALGMPRWEVEARAEIGFFSFTKYLMWLDLAAREDLLASPVLRHLVETPGATLAQEVPEVPRDELDDLDPAEIYCPKDADSSQLAAVLAAAAGRTFVLEGPPGTGKSQTITNLVAQALANDKRVLFVAEKRAALEVVQRRLDSVGLGAFCLELHSSKSGPKAVLEQLRRALEFGLRREPRGWRELAGELAEERRRVNRHVRAMHARREHGFSVFGALGKLVGLREAPRVPMPALLEGHAGGVPADIAAARRAVGELVAASQNLGVPEGEVWWGVRRGEWSPALLRDIVPVAERLQRAVEAFAGAVRRVATAFGVDRALDAGGPSREQLELLLELAALFAAPSLPPSELVRCEPAVWRRHDEVLTALVATGRRRDELWAPLAERWRRELLALDLDALASAYRGAAESFFLLRWWRLRRPRRELAAVAADGAVLGRPTAVRDDLLRALDVRAEEHRLAAADAATTTLLGRTWNDGLADWERIVAWTAWVRDARRIALALVPGALQPSAAILAGIAAQLDGLADGAAELPRQLGTLRSTHDEFRAALDVARSLLELDVDEAFGAGDAPDHLDSVAARVRRWLGDVPRLREQCAYARAAADATELGAGPLVAEHAAGRLATTELPAAFERTFLESWLDAVGAAEPELAMFRGTDHERAIERFRELDRRAIELAAEVIVARLAARLPRLRDTQVSSSELGILERELKKQRRHKPVRRLLAEIPGLLRRLAPCVLMSPLSVAQFLGRSGARFDLVVFDEASQIPMWDAVGAIGRGDSVIVVGDSRQLPPTSFFQRLDQGDDVGDDELPEDLESVLDECGAAGLPRMYLDWHYRSRHESLIAFSNHHYYDDRLLTFPAPQQAVAGIGVSFEFVQGVYDRGTSQQNRIEAERLVEDVLRRLRDETLAQRSIGIVTFGRAQQVLIEDLLDRARATDPAIEPFFTAVEEPVFVKNLENVQGDERDTILFSICYGPDAAGKVYENYGPLNQQGGERRLNVAVTRARRELVVFSSLRADQVATRTAAVGARHLRAFLDYAERGQVALAAAIAADPSGAVESPFEAAVRDALLRRGHELHAQVGCSGYRIDLCIVDPEAPGSYLLGVECDGATYHAAATARDRDRIRAGVLRGLGWRLHRVWSMDFWQDPEGEIARIEAALAAAVAERRAARDAQPPRIATGAAVATPVPTPLPGSDRAREPVKEPAAEPAAAEDPFGPRPYVAADLRSVDRPDDFHEKASWTRVRSQIEEVLAIEAPIAFDRLAKTVATAWGVTRVTERVRARVRAALPGETCELDGVLHVSIERAERFRGFRVPSGDATSERPAEDLPLIEVVNAMSWLLRQHHALSADDLARETARCFGINRLGTVVRGVMDSGLERLVAAELAVRDGDTVRLPD